jgi:catechol 2,3-dioxygenase-like lactoylglutathione lyase family enzyme
MAQLLHASLTVENLARSLAFYRDVAEMTEGEHLNAISKAFDTFTDPGAALKVALILLPALSCSSFSSTQLAAVLLWTFITAMLAARKCLSMCRMSRPSTKSPTERRT